MTQNLEPGAEVIGLASRIDPAVVQAPKPCIAIEGGKKKLTRNQNCVCPSGWHQSDKVKSSALFDSKISKFSRQFSTDYRSLGLSNKTSVLHTNH